MTRALLVGAALLVAAGTGFAQQTTVHMRAGGEWTQVQARVEDGVVSFAVTPDQAPDGRALVVINRPEWMVLDDEQPPRVVSYAIGEGTAELDDAAALDLGALGDDDRQRRVTLNIADEANPVDAESLRLRLPGAADAVTSVVEERPADRFAALGLDLSGLGPGAYEGTVEVADMAPLRNTARLPVRFSIAGVEVAPDEQTIRLSAAGASFTAAGQGRANVTVDAADVSAYITVQGGGDYFYLGEFTAVEDLGARNGWHIVEAQAALETKDGDPVSAEEAELALAYRFAIHRSQPVVLVTSRVTNLADEERDLYVFWGWLPGERYVTSDGEAHEWSMEYDDIDPDGWVYLPPRSEGRPGVGWISPLDFGESRFGTMILYTRPKHIPTPPGESISQTFALMPATASEKVAEAADALAQAGGLRSVE